jgi:hypothetical protein
LSWASVITRCRYHYPSRCRLSLPSLWGRDGACPHSPVPSSLGYRTSCLFVFSVDTAATAPIPARTPSKYTRTHLRSIHAHTFEVYTHSPSKYTRTHLPSIHAHTTRQTNKPASHTLPFMPRARFRVALSLWRQPDFRSCNCRPGCLPTLRRHVLVLMRSPLRPAISPPRRPHNPPTPPAALLSPYFFADASGGSGSRARSTHATLLPGSFPTAGVRTRGEKGGARQGVFSSGGESGNEHRAGNHTFEKTNLFPGGGVFTRLGEGADFNIHGESVSSSHFEWKSKSSRLPTPIGATGFGPRQVTFTHASLQSRLRADLFLHQRACISTRVSTGEA